MCHFILEHFIATQVTWAKSPFMIFTLILKWNKPYAAFVCSLMPLEHLTDVIDAYMPL
jgi:hypothetical protein